MQSSPKMFQMVLMGVFVILLILGFLGFSGKLDSILPTSKKDISYGQVTLWGTLPSSVMQSLIGAKLSSNKEISVKYVEKNAATFDRDFVEALASGKGPDMVLLPQDDIIKNLNKLNLIPYQTITERDFKDTFLQEGEMFLRPEGIVALPLTLDPLVMYWNRDIFTNAGVVTPPSFWEQFYDLVPKITVRDQSGNISRSLVSFGGYRNVSHAKEILSIFMLQAGSPIVSSQNGSLVASLVSGNSSAENPVVSAVRFYTEFSKHDKDSYSWNSSLPSSRAMFEAGDLATYFGYASEYQSIQQRNPHLNFDAAVVPQAKNTPLKLTFGRMQGLAITLATGNPQGALHAGFLLTSKDFIEGLGVLTGLPPVLRDLYSVRQEDAIRSVFYDSAIIARAWQDPSSVDTNSIFMSMIDSINSGRSNMNEALSVAQSSLQKLVQSNQ